MSPPRASVARNNPRTSATLAVSATTLRSEAGLVVDSIQNASKLPNHARRKKDHHRRRLEVAGAGGKGSREQSGSPEAGAEAAANAGSNAARDVQMPPASLEMLVTTLVTEAMISLGQVPHPQTGEVVFQPLQAKYLIDTIDMLREKTKGNVTADETDLMEQLLHQLRLAYVQLTCGPQSRRNRDAVAAALAEG